MEVKSLEFRKICRDACINLNLPDPDRLGESGHVAVDGIEFGLLVNDEVVPDRMQLFVDIGSVAQCAQSTIYRNLLSLNMTMGAVQDGVFGIDESTGRVVFASRIVMADGLSGMGLARLLRGFARMATGWRQSLLEGAPPASVQNRGLFDS